jgi:hypothetical protein
MKIAQYIFTVDSHRKVMAKYIRNYLSDFIVRAAQDQSKCDEIAVASLHPSVIFGKILLGVLSIRVV